MSNNKGGDDPKDSGKHSTWLFRSREGKGDHLLTGKESKDESGKKTTIFSKPKPGNSNN